MLESLRAALGDRYLVEREVGRGGMSLVYLARDLRHDRAVALKVLRPELSVAVGPERFLNEIRLTANLQHAHILPLYDSGAVDGLLYYVMPFVEGESLRDRLTRERQLPIAEALRIATQAARALEYAHKKGVLHRDIKPENILLQDGQALIADFGIALAVRQAGGPRLTETGLTLGTPQYMSPEQSVGDREIDARSDLYSLATVLYETLAGEPPFCGPTAQAILARVVTEHARPIREARDTVPPALEAALQQALARLPADRFSTAAEFAEALGRVPLAATPDAAFPGAAPVRRGPRRVAWPIAGVAVAALTVGTALGWRLGRSGGTESIVRFEIPTASRQVDEAFGWLPTLALGPTADDLVFRNGALLYRRALDDVAARPLPGTERASMPAFSPDGQWLAFHQDGQLKKLALAGGAAVDLAAADPGPGLWWGEDGWIYFSSLGGNGGIWRVPATGGTPEPVTQVADSAAEYIHAWPELLPGGKELLFTVVGPSSGAVDSRIVVETLGSDTRRTVAEQVTFGRYLRSGHLIFVSNAGAVFAAGYDLRTGTLVGTPQPVIPDVDVASWGGAALLAVAGDGTLAFAPGITAAPQVLRVVDRSGRQLDEIVPVGAIDGARLSSDGRIAANVRAPSKNDIWLFGREGEPERLTFDETEDEDPVWSPDGRAIAYTSSLASQARRLQIKAVAAGTRPRRILTWPRRLHLTSWSPDGQWLAGFDENQRQRQDVWAIAADGSDSIPVAAGPSAEAFPDFSPDGRWVAFESDESGRFEIFVISFPDLGVKRQISNNGGQKPRWSSSGDALYYLEGGRLVSVPMSLQSGLRQGPTQVLFETTAAVFDVASDDRRFVMALANPALVPPAIQVTLHWTVDLVRSLAQAR